MDQLPTEASHGNMFGLRSGPVFLFCYLTQIAGAYLKRGPLQQRRSLEGSPGDGLISLLKNLSVTMAFITHAIFFILALNDGLETIFVHYFHFSLGDINSDFFIGLHIVIVLIFGLLPTGMVACALTSPSQPLSHWRYLRSTEMLADGCLFFSALIGTVLGDLFIQDIVSFFRSEGRSFWGAFLPALFLMSAPLLLFYLPTRLLFLAEEYRYPRTWIRVALFIFILGWRLW